MSLWLCRQEQVKHPFYVESLGIHLYSSQELAYVIYNHPTLVMDGFVGEGLLEFLREDLNMGFLALKLERWLKSSENPDETLVMILQECDYYKSAEITRFRQKLATMREKHPAEFGKLRADELFGLRQYGRAVKLYQELLEYPDDSYVDAKYRGCIWNNLASAYARMFRFTEACEAYGKAYGLLADEGILEQVYHLTRLDGRVKLSDHLQSLMTEELRKAWDGDLEDAREKAEQSGQVARLDELFNRDPIKRQAGEAALLKRWKQEYRAMV